MLRETCPDEFSEVDVEPARSPPPTWTMVAAPVALCLATVLVAWVHVALGSPLGPAWATEMWGWAKTAIAATVSASAFGVWAGRQNAANVAALRLARQEAAAAMSASTLPRVRQTGPHKVLQTGRQRVEPEVVDDEEAGPW